MEASGFIYIFFFSEIGRLCDSGCTRLREQRIPCGAQTKTPKQAVKRRPYFTSCSMRTQHLVQV